MIRFKVADTPVVRMSVSGGAAKLQVQEAVVVWPDSNPYEGPYEVTPKADEQQTLPTKQKFLREDVTVLSVPYYETDNQNGTTIFIASEV